MEYAKSDEQKSLMPAFVIGQRFDARLRPPVCRWIAPKALQEAFMKTMDDPDFKRGGRSADRPVTAVRKPTCRPSWSKFTIRRSRCAEAIDISASRRNR